MSIEDKTNKFWDWFVANESIIIRATEDESISRTIVENLDNLILDFGAFSWEIGPGNNTTWFLTISPNENKDLLSISQLIVENAPNLKNWEFNYFKPAKIWNREFVVYDELMDEQTIDASNWKYVALKHQDEIIEIIIEADNIQHLDEDTAQSAANLVVMSEIGEEVKINKVASVDIVNELDEQYASKRSDIENLKVHILDI